MSEKNTVLVEKLRLPTPKDRVKFRVGYKSRDESQACMLAYVDARYVMDTLDDIVGTDNWNLEYHEIHGGLFCKITVAWPDGSTSSKMDCGTETDVEKEKGQASDAFKRAAVHFGIARDLYGMPDYWAPINEYGYAEKNWTPPGWGADAGRIPTATEPNKAPSHPITSASQPESASKLQDFADDVVKKASKDAPDDYPDGYIAPEKAPTSADSPPQVANQGLKEGTPPENEVVLAKNLKNQKTSQKGAILYLPQDFTGNPTDYEETKPYWVPAQYIMEEIRLMSGLCNVKMTRWIADEKNYDYDEIKDGEDDLPF